MPGRLTIRSLLKEAKLFAAVESKFPEPALYGVTDGKAVGTYFEHKFRAYLAQKYTEILSIVVDEEFCQAATSWDLTPSVN